MDIKRLLFAERIDFMMAKFGESLGKAILMSAPLIASEDEQFCIRFHYVINIPSVEILVAVSLVSDPSRSEPKIVRRLTFKNFQVTIVISLLMRCMSFG